ncbi:pyridoxal phosphate-dependent transferase [Geranomyces variabilis]|nr:pyridoxal phosphate-dependent transferase [Geranomyces variabilis]KAJ3131422.1 Threonine aldolase [Geranomyces variabilis]
MYQQPSSPPLPIKGNVGGVGDFRSDTVTQPTDAMRQAMLAAPVGDDVYGEDPSVLSLQARMMELTGHPAALFVASATMSNQLAARTHLTQPPHSVICDHRAHMHTYEAGGVSFFTGASIIPVDPERYGARHLTAESVRPNLCLDDDVHHAPTRLVCMENTMNGEVVPIENIRQVTRLAREHGIATHLDGARLWNASAATGISLQEYCSHFDSITLCLSKGLGCPIGSILVGSKQFIRKATHFRKMFGGGWRQAGILAAAAHHALDHNLPNLPNDHANAAFLAHGLSALGLELTRPADTNMVWVRAPFPASILSDRLAEHGITIFSGEATELRFVVHLQITREHCEKVIEVVRDVVRTSEGVEK